MWWHLTAKTEGCWAPVEPVERGNCPSEIMSVQSHYNKVTLPHRKEKYSIIREDVKKYKERNVFPLLIL